MAYREVRREQDRAEYRFAFTCYAIAAPHFKKGEAPKPPEQSALLQEP